MELAMSTDIRFLKGVGEKRAAHYQKLNIHTVSDLLYHFPRDYLDFSKPHTVSSAPLSELCAIKATLISKGREQRIRKGLSVYKLKAQDDTGDIQITLFNTKYMVEQLVLDEPYIFYGRVSGSLLQKEMSAPLIFSCRQTAGSILPIYPQTAGISSALIRKNITQVLGALGQLKDPLPDDLRTQQHLPDLADALQQVHLPNTLSDAHKARERFVFEELLTLSLALSAVRDSRIINRVQPLQPINMDPFYALLPFQPTGAQLRCIEESLHDMCSEIPMNRLIQGDVGSGKTLVVAACVYFAVKNSYQSAVMVPTEILAEQHFSTLSNMLAPLGVTCALLTGSTKPSKKKLLIEQLERGEIDLCIGTHALLSDGVAFHNLNLVVTDEQHRFGVSQRSKLSQKSANCHVMVLSATPIPRTLSLIIYGDLSLSVIDELPPGRQMVKTYIIDSSKRTRALNFIKQAVNNKQQAYIICPLIEQGEVDTNLQPAIDYAQRLSHHELSGYRIGLLHGKMKAQEKEQVMHLFKSGEIQVLVSTTVVEVGVDVPNATIMLIENAERFGLSQLHQLRGRIGRGTEKSHCILLSDAKGQTARERLQVMRTTNDGFAIAEHDLKLRGPGDFFGYRQHGLPALRVADLGNDLSAMQQVQDCAQKILAEDPTLEHPKYNLLAQATQKMLAAIGERPN